jgi:hypothetical protein
VKAGKARKAARNKKLKVKNNIRVENLDKNNIDN